MLEGKAWQLRQLSEGKQPNWWTIARNKNNWEGKQRHIFACILFTRNYMIFLVQFGINQNLVNFSKTTNCTRPTGSYNLISLWEFTRADLSQIALEVMRLPLQIVRVSSKSKECAVRVWLKITSMILVQNYTTQRFITNISHRF